MEKGQTPWVSGPGAEDVTDEYLPALPGAREPQEVWRLLSQHAHDRYAAQWRDEAVPQLVEFEHGPAAYLFDTTARPRAERTVLVVGRPEPPSAPRDSAYQAGYPVPKTASRRPVDRGHYLPYSGGGLFGPNMFIQDRALNSGWSRQGRMYRALEQRAVGTPNAILFARPAYDNHSDIPVTVDLGLVDHAGCLVHRFRNRYDDITVGHGSTVDDDDLRVVLNGAVSAQIGALGEETAAAFLVDELDATIVDMGAAGMPRRGAAQGLDIVAVVDGTLVVFEVKTTFCPKRRADTPVLGTSPNRECGGLGDPLTHAKAVRHTRRRAWRTSSTPEATMQVLRFG